MSLIFLTLSLVLSTYPNSEGQTNQTLEWMKCKLWFLEKYFLFLAILYMSNDVSLSTFNNYHNDVLELLYHL